ncbi:hypothetical protein ACFOPQ_19915 [Deinococcus antarcticus]|uniref:Uncharacterized protein n=1 Tax=Deinococcus antarcticus TaxID=1298767 RepID=A0ABV8ABE3_9DEIO
MHKPKLSLMTVITSGMFALSTNGTATGTLAEQRLQTFLDFRMTSSATPQTANCDLLRPSSQDAISIAFKYNSSTPAFAMVRGMVFLLEHQNNRTVVIGVAQTAGYRKSKNYLSDIFHGNYRNVCGKFSIPWGIFFRPLTYYSIDPRQGEVIIGELNKTGDFTGRNALHYESGGEKLRLLPLKSERP